jgi:hypothetical protein
MNNRFGILKIKGESRIWLESEVLFMQQYVHHMVPNEFEGDKLIPLNSLKNPYPQLYEKYTKKYFDHPERPKLLK